MHTSSSPNTPPPIRASPHRNPTLLLRFTYFSVDYFTPNFRSNTHKTPKTLEEESHKKSAEQSFFRNPTREMN
ncbi:hypothetical protein L484_006091 [Morus notabilis]|uniref:Uncharacterized protein n=1 Tax=Morus notabilis TaxID=981085 RepID=W9SB06_9ROSA|nr:hypothetical protein L484_006091 [Morus notabilis]